MWILLLSMGWAALVAFLLFRAIRQYGYYQVIRPDNGGNDDAPALAIIIPARNEGPNIGGCLAGLLRQNYPVNQVRIFVVNDGSTDDTAEVVRSAAREDPRVKLIEGEPLPPGWTGKTHACWQGARAALNHQGPNAGAVEWLCFLDADTRAEPALLHTAIHTATQRGLDLLSLEPFQELVSPWERLILPAGFFLIAFTQDVRRANDPNDPEAHANGQFILIRRSAYESVGTFAAVRGHIAEDSALARAVKRGGGRVAVLGTQGLIRTRMYRDLRSLWQGLSRQAGELLRTPSRCVAAACFGLLLAWTTVVLPTIAWSALHEHGAHATAIAAFALSTAASLAMMGTHIGAAVYFRIPFWYGILFPIGYTLGAGIAIHSALGRARRQVIWKSRAYAPVDVPLKP